MSDLRTPKKNRLLLVSAIIGCIYAVLVIWGIVAVFISDSTVADTASIKIGFLERLKNILQYLRENPKEGGILLICFAVLACMVAAPVLGFLAWLKGGKKKLIISGVLYVLSLSWLAALINFLVLGLDGKITPQNAQTAPQKGKMLLVSGIFGVLGFALCVVMYFAPMMQRTDGTGSDVFFSEMIKVANGNTAGIAVVLSVFLCSLLIPLIAAVFNFMSWRDSDKRKCLASGIFYIPALNIVSAVLSFVAFAKIRKAQQASGQ